MRILRVETFGEESVALATFVTMGRIKEKLGVKLFENLVRAKHSPIKEYKIQVIMAVSERVHTHLIRHSSIDMYVSTKRPDIDYGSSGAFELLDDEDRIIMMTVNAKRLIEMSMVRLCNKAWKETKDVMLHIKQRLSNSDKIFDRVLSKYLQPSCVWYGMCPERPKGCGFIKTHECKLQRDSILGTSV
jgi:hypothetical protein